MEQTTIQKTGWKIQCICDYTWVYCGSRSLFACCPRCHTTLTLQPKRKKLLPEAKEKQDDKKPLRTTTKKLATHAVVQTKDREKEDKKD